MPGKKAFLCLVFICVFCLSALTQEEKAATASMNKIKLEFSLYQNDIPSYAVYFGGKPVILPSRLGFKLNDTLLLDNNFKVIKIDSVVFLKGTGDNGVQAVFPKVPLGIQISQPNFLRRRKRHGTNGAVARPITAFIFLS